MLGTKLPLEAVRGAQVRGQLRRPSKKHQEPHLQDWSRDVRVQTGLRKVIARAYRAPGKANLTWGYTENDSGLRRRARSGGKGLS